MKITYVSHSGFAVELPSATLLFDYYKGALPPFSEAKPLFVFSSHHHGDHFNPDIFELAGRYPEVHFLLSHDIHTSRRKYLQKGVPDAALESAVYFRAHETRSFPCPKGPLTVSTLRSTDLGVAFLIRCGGRYIYHAGDLNWWLWKGDSKQEAGNMAANFKREIDTLAGLTLELAFVPLDPRQEEYYGLGINYLLDTAQIRHLFPMHFWDDYAVIPRYQAEFPQMAQRTQLHLIEREGQVWELSDEA